MTSERDSTRFLWQICIKAVYLWIVSLAIGLVFFPVVFFLTYLAFVLYCFYLCASVAFFKQIVVVYCILHLRSHSAIQSITRNQQVPAHPVLIEIYSGIERFPCDSTAFLFMFSTKGANSPLHWWQNVPCR